MPLETHATRPRDSEWLTFKPFAKILALAAVALSAFTPLAHAALVSGTITLNGLAKVNNGSGGLETAVTIWGTITNYGGSGSFTNVPVGTVVSFAPGTWIFGTNVAIPNFWTASGFSFKLVHSSVTIDHQNFELVGFGDAVVSGNGYTPTVCSGSMTFTDPTVGGYTPFQLVCTSTGVSAAPVPPVLSLQRISKKIVLTWTDATFSLQASPSLTNTFTNIPSATSPYTNISTAPIRYFRLFQ